MLNFSCLIRKEGGAQNDKFVWAQTMRATICDSDRAKVISMAKQNYSRFQTPKHEFDYGCKPIAYGISYGWLETHTAQARFPVTFISSLTFSLLICKYSADLFIYSIKSIVSPIFINAVDEQHLTL